MAATIPCPSCAAPLHVLHARPGERIFCPGCGAPYVHGPQSAAPPGPPPLPVRPAPLPPPPQTAPVATVTPIAPPVPVSVVPTVTPVAPAAAPTATHRGAVLLALFGGLLLLAGAAVGLALLFANNTPDKGPPDWTPSGDQVVQDGPRDEIRPIDTDRNTDRRTPKDRPKEPPKTPPPLAAEEQKRVDAAIAAGVAYLKKSQNATTGVWDPPGPNPPSLGYNALLALTLLECGVKPDDASVKRAIDYVREKCVTNNQTYEISLAILMLDKVGMARDQKLIQKLALRLIHYQGRDGGWTYGAFDPMSDKEEDALLAALKATRPLSIRDIGLDPDKDPKGEITAAAVYAKALEPLTGTLKTIPALQPPDRIAGANALGWDNSNTQFAVIALWVAGRHGVPTERALALCARHFRTTQQADGHWTYQPGAETGPAMTGAGVIGLAVGHGLVVRLHPDDLKKAQVDDKAIQQAMTNLAANIGTPLGPKANRPKNRDRNQVNLYYFWTLERVGVMFSATKVNGKDWYQWGAELLVDNQNGDGSWNCGNYPGSTAWADTAFALLFLKRANLVADLSSKIDFTIEAK